jgi:hypothetical protein
VWEYEEGHTVKTDEERQHILQVAQHSRQTAALLCKRVRAQQALVQHELSNLAKRRHGLHELLDQLRKIRGTFHYARAQQHDREVAALINILQRMPLSSQF